MTRKNLRLHAPLCRRDALLGLDLDVVLEGPDVVPIVDPPDRQSEVVYLPRLTTAERAAAQQDYVDERRVQRARDRPSIDSALVDATVRPPRPDVAESQTPPPLTEWTAEDQREWDMEREYERTQLSLILDRDNQGSDYSVAPETTTPRSIPPEHGV